MELNVLADQADGYGLFQMPDLFYQILPFIKIRLACLQVQLPADDVGKVLLFQHQRSLVEMLQSSVFHYAVSLDVAEESQLVKYVLFQGSVAAKDQNVGVYAQPLKDLYRMLSRLARMFLAAFKIGDKGHMNIQGISRSNFQSDLPYGFKERLAFNVSNCASDLTDEDVRIIVPYCGIDEFLDLIGDVGNDLNRLAQIFSPAFLIQDIPVYSARGEIGISVQIFVDESFIVTEIQIGFSTVFGNEHFAMLVRRHGSRVNIDVGIKFLRGDFKASGFQKTAKGSGSNALA